MEFEGKVALVTGGSRGIGRACALRLAGEGATVVLNYAVGEAPAKEVQREIEDKGGKCVLRRFDVSEHYRVSEEISSIANELGGLHILVNNAGVTKDGFLIRMKE